MQVPKALHLTICCKLSWVFSSTWRQISADFCFNIEIHNSVESYFSFEKQNLRHIIYIYIYIYYYYMYIPKALHLTTCCPLPLRSVLIISIRKSSDRGSQKSHAQIHGSMHWIKASPLLFSENVCVPEFKAPGSGRTFKTWIFRNWLYGPSTDSSTSVARPESAEYGPALPWTLYDKTWLP